MVATTVLQAAVVNVQTCPCHSTDSVCLDGLQNSHKAVLAELKEPWVEVRDVKKTL